MGLSLRSEYNTFNGNNYKIKYIHCWENMPGYSIDRWLYVGEKKLNEHLHFINEKNMAIA